MKHLFSAFLVLFLVSCVKETGKTSKQTYWVNSYKQECIGIGPKLCLLIQKGDTIKTNEWQSFYSSINGFDYNTGFVYKLSVEEKIIPTPPADGSSIDYTLIKEELKIQDPTVNLHDIWVLKIVSDDMFIAPNQAPTLEINLTKKTIMGSDGCNNYNGTIHSLSEKEISFGPIAATSKMCINMTIPDLYHEKLKTVKSYELQGLTLMLKNEAGETILTFQKVD